MAYEKQNWVCGDTLTAEKLNHMEDGIANAGGGGTPLIVTLTKEGEECEGGGTAVKATCNHSWQEIYDALTNDTPVYLKEIHQESGQVGVMLKPIIGAATNNSTLYAAYTTTESIDLSFPNATDKEWYSQPCK